ncbi:MAG: hypothetical protein ACI3YX_06780, partial [Prevotella sp.]
MIFHPLSPSAELPKAMNDPFDYSPHPLCLSAAAALQQMLPALMAAHPCVETPREFDPRGQATMTPA